MFWLFLPPEVFDTNDRPETSTSIDHHLSGLCLFLTGVPLIAEPLCDQTVTDGESVELSCTVKIDPDIPLTIKWYQGNHLVEHSEDYCQVFSVATRLKRFSPHKKITQVRRRKGRFAWLLLDLS